VPSGTARRADFDEDHHNDGDIPEPTTQTMETEMKKLMIAAVAATVALQASFAPAAEARGLGLGVGLGVGLGAGLLMGQMQRQQAMQQQQMYEAKRRQEIARMRAAEMQRQKAAAIAEARAKAVAEAKAKAEAEAKAKLADGGELPTPAGKTPVNQTADATVSSALVAADTTLLKAKTGGNATEIADEPAKATGNGKGKTKIADCRKFVPSVGMTINVPCN
jgi:colicin import membrane protein